MFLLTELVMLSQKKFLLNKMKHLFVFFLILVCSCKAQDIGALPVPKSQTILYLKDFLKFKFGAAVNPTLLNGNTSYRNLFDTEFQSVTAENMMKMGQIHPEKDRFDWSKANVIVEAAQKNNQRIHGHTLIWHSNIPNWLLNFEGDQKAWETVIKTHIQTVVQYYKGKVGSWDVVNEAFNDNGSLRNSLFKEKLGDDYIAKCFAWAREADPNVLLFYNDYGQEYAPAKLQAILDLVADFKKRNISIDGIGLQMHININSSDAGIATAIQKSAATGLLVHLSELDIAVNPSVNENFVYDEVAKQKQSIKFIYVFNTFRKIPTAQQFGITTWNIGDSDTWLRPFKKTQKEFPMLFDENYKRKAFYEDLYKAVQL